MSNPRVISGTAKGIRLQVATGGITRPITDRVKEALFNIIGSDIQGTNFLDVFAGTGSVGIEALSRGALFARFVDLNLAAFHVLRKNLESTNLLDKAELIHSNALLYLNQKPDIKFDYVFVAPPQYHSIWNKTLALLDKRSAWLGSDAWVVVQIDPIEYASLKLVNLKEFDSRKYGSSLLVFYGYFTS
jgi:16S rRNA (guanine966-N2)-methyltransferase